MLGCAQLQAAWGRFTDGALGEPLLGVWGGGSPRRKVFHPVPFCSIPYLGLRVLGANLGASETRMGVNGTLLERFGTDLRACPPRRSGRVVVHAWEILARAFVDVKAAHDLKNLVTVGYRRRQCSSGMRLPNWAPHSPPASSWASPGWWLEWPGPRAQLARAPNSRPAARYPRRR